MLTTLAERAEEKRAEEKRAEEKRAEQKRAEEKRAEATRTHRMPTGWVVAEHVRACQGTKDCEQEAETTGYWPVESADQGFRSRQATTFSMHDIHPSIGTKASCLKAKRGRHVRERGKHVRERHVAQAANADHTLSHA